MPDEHEVHPMQAVHGDQIVEDKTEQQFNIELSKVIAKRADYLRNDTVELALRVLAAQEHLEWSCHHIRHSWVEWQKAAHDALEELRQLRFAFTTEGKQILSEAKDVRRFFLDDKHQEEITELKEFVEVCERLEGLKNRGTLDALVDVILKLGVKEDIPKEWT